MTHPARLIPGTLRALGVATVLALAAAATLGVDRAPANRAAIARPLVGDFTGEVVAAGPVYRLPVVHVVADRATERARMEREERAVAAHVSERAPAFLVQLLVKEIA